MGCVAGTPSHPIWKHRRFLQQWPLLPDLQCSWLLFSMRASLRAKHALRTLLPSESQGYAQPHEMAVWETSRSCMGGFCDDSHHAWPIATLPAVHGGLGLQSAAECAASTWAAALPEIHTRTPEFARRCLAAFDNRGSGRVPPRIRARDHLPADVLRGAPSCNGHARPRHTMQSPETSHMVGLFRRPCARERA